MRRQGVANDQQRSDGQPIRPDTSPSPTPLDSSLWRRSRPIGGWPIGM